MWSCTKMSFWQVSFFAPHSIPDQLLPVHAVLRLHPRNHGQVDQQTVRNLTTETGGSSGRRPSNTPHYTRILVSSSSGISLFCFKASELQMVHVASYLLVRLLQFHLRSNVHRGEELARQAQVAILGYPKIHYTGKKLHLYMEISMYMSWLIVMGYYLHGSILSNGKPKPSMAWSKKPYSKPRNEVLRF